MLRSKSFKKGTITMMMMMASLLVLCLTIASLVHSSPTEEEIVAITNSASTTTSNNNTIIEDTTNNNNNPVKITNDAAKKSKIVSVLCPADHEMVYNFKASTLLGTKPHLQSVSAIKKGSSQENTVMGKMTLTCAGSTNNKNLIAVSFPSVQFLQFQGMKKYGNLGKKDINFWFNKKYRTLQKRRDLTKSMNKYPLAIVRSKTGQVSKMIFHKREPFWLKSIKKGLVRVLTTETKKVQRKQTDGFGSAYTQKFNKTQTPKKTTQVIQKFSEKDFKKVAPKKRSIGYEGSHIVKINKKGLITRALMGTRVTMGKRPALPSFKKFEKETGKKKKFVTKNKDQVQTLNISTLKLSKVNKKKATEIPKIISKFFDITKGAVAVKPQFVIIKTFGMTKQDRKDAKKMISKTFKTKALKKLLSSVKKDFKSVSPVTNKKLSKVAKYVSKSPVKASKVLMTELMKGVLALKKISPTEPVTKKIIPYIESVQSLIASVNSTKVQNKLAKISKVHPVLVKNYPYASILIKKPTKEVFTFLKNLKSNSTKHNSIQKTNAFLAYADLADRSTDVAINKEIINDIMTELMTASSQESFLTAIHALNNAGKGVPLSIIKSIILSEKMPETIKNLIVENLKKRTTSADINVDALIHSLIKNKKLSDSVVASLISAQTDREGLIKNGTSIGQFVALLKKNPSELVKNAIKNYFYAVGSEESAKALEDSYEQTTEMVAQSDIDEEGVTLELSEEETSAKSKVEQVADKIKSYFESANWNGAKSTCVAANKSGEKMCIYNNEMLNFVKKQGDLSTISKSKFYSYENKFGTNGINIYTGFVVYGGASFDCSKDAAFDAVFFGRAAAEANLFDNTYPVASAYAELNNRGSSSINNRVFVKLFTTTFADKPFLPSVTVCADETKNILTKSIPNLIKTSYTMTVGPVPITFSFGVGISYGVDLKYAYCLNSFSASLSLEPTLVADITGAADVGIPLAKATISISASATTRGVPKLSFSSCNLCASLSYKLESANFEANLKGKVAVWEKSWTLYTYSLPIAYSKTLYEQCVTTKLPTI